MLKEWRGHFTARPVSKKYKKPISAASAYAVCGAIRYFLDWCDIEQLWVPCHRWREAFKNISEKKLKTRIERTKNKRMGFFNFTIQEMRFIWHACLSQNRVLVGLALWCGHTQNELATILRDGEFIEVDGEMYLERDRNKTGVYGRWWVPPELAVLVRERLEKTPESYKENPLQLAFLTGHSQPLVHFAKAGKRTRSDAVAQFWVKTVRLVECYGVRYHSFKYLRKTLAQQVRDRLGVEYATLFSAEVIKGVQDESYTNACFAKLERCIREDLYSIWKEMFKAFTSEELEGERERIRKMSDPVASIDGSHSQSSAVAV